MNATVKIDPDGFYTDRALDLMGISATALAQARKSGELKHRRVGRRGRALYRGSWVLSWLDRAGEPAPSQACGQPAA